MTTMLEKMARAMFPEAFKEAPHGNVFPDRIPEALAKTRAGLLAIRDPDYGMVTDALDGYTANAIWTELIDAILNEKPETT